MKTILLSLLIFTSVLITVRADGPHLGPDKLYSEGAVVILHLNEDQKRFLGKEFKTRREEALKLTPEQSKKLEEIFSVRTTLLEVWDTRKYGTDCTCTSSNVALRFTNDYVEVLKPYLRSDAEALAIWKAADQNN